MIAICVTLPEQGGYAMDRSFQTYMAGWRGESATAAMKALSGIGSTAGIIAITLAVAAIVGWRMGWRHAAILIGAMIAGYGLNAVLKAGIGRVRPSDAWGIAVDGASFPSANAMLGMILFGLLAMFAVARSGMRGWLKGTMAAICFLMILLLGLSRLYFHVHYLSDILAGYASGLAIVAGAMLLPFKAKEIGKGA
ncbi:phosphatase PAP2 family protein [Paenibacillus sp. LHD-117]|uniref:phosphatase PAP2 family protein n=1 Tax=Paenibacillus sp. LHD-117 TaxID=3071412 RepID=UPI0027DF099E|nr:phosphatase PAP2 family protein [Paenibacillus sp. LHD-117]MDQ6418154.1 phosphatase PAP2 family protein [Paenibacillus sp. LHD-117]